MNRSPGTFALVALSLLVLTGCVGAQPDSEQSSPPPSTTPTAEVPVTDPIAEGDCDGFLPPEQTSAALGVAVPVNEDVSGTTDPGPGERGGIQCTWTWGEQGDPEGARFEIAVEPSATADPAAVAASLAQAGTCETHDDLITSNAGCIFAGETAGWWYSGRFFVFTSAAEQAALLSDVTRLVDDALASHPRE